MTTTHPVLRWKIGTATISRVVEIEGPSPGTFLFAEATPERLLQHAWLQPHFLTPDGRTLGAIHAFVIESAGRVILVDTCVGNDKPRTVKPWHLRKGRFLEDLAAAGFARERVDTVLCTHLHVDHVGWNTMLVDGHWAPTFPNARYLFARSEWEYWSRQSPSHDGDVYGDSVQPILDAGLADLVATDHRVTEEVRFEHTPGHTPGHVSVRIASGGEEAVITGDLMHHPVQCAEPLWASRFDVDPDAARATRRAFLERHAGRPVLVLGTHFAAPTGGRIVQDGEAWRFDAAQPPETPPPGIQVMPPIAAMAVFCGFAFAGRDSWWGIVPNLVALGFLAFALWTAFSRREFENARRRHPSISRFDHVTSAGLVYFVLPALLWLLFGLPFLSHWLKHWAR